MDGPVYAREAQWSRIAPLLPGKTSDADRTGLNGCGPSRGHLTTLRDMPSADLGCELHRCLPRHPQLWECCCDQNEGRPAMVQAVLRVSPAAFSRPRDCIKALRLAGPHRARVQWAAEAPEPPELQQFRSAISDAIWFDDWRPKPPRIAHFTLFRYSAEEWLPELNVDAGLLPIAIKVKAVQLLKEQIYPSVDVDVLGQPSCVGASAS